ncbi:PAS domain S-box protein [Chloroflexota bacterium]
MLKSKNQIEDTNKTKEQLIEELGEARHRVAELERLQTEHDQYGKLFEVLANSSTIGIYIVQDGKCRYVNSMFQQLVGYSESELEGMYSISLVHPEDRDMVKKNAVKMLKGERFLPYEFRYITKSGETKSVMEAIASIHYQGRQASLGSFMDITERKQAEDKYRQLVEYIHDGYAVVQGKKIAFTNVRFSEIFGYKPGQGIGLPLTRFVGPDVRDEYMVKFNRILRGEESAPDRIESTAVKADGTTIIVEVTGTVIQYEGKPAVSFIIRDITERKQAKERRKAAIKMASDMIENMPAGVSIHDMEGRVIDVNRAATEMLGYTKEELIGRTPLEAVKGKGEQVKALKAIVKLFSGEPVRGIEYQVMNKNGNEFPALVDISVLKDPAGNPLSTIVVFEDITQRKQMEKQLDERELAILRMIANGSKTREIATRFSLSETTIKRDVRIIIQKFGVHNRSEAVAEAYKRQLI